MPSLKDVLATVDGLRSDTARRVREQFPTLASLAAAPRDELEEIKGVGQVLSGRLVMAAARAHSTATDPDAATSAAKDATAAGMAVATEAVDAVGKVGRKLAQSSETASEVARHSEIAAKTGVFRAHASADKAIDRTADVVGPAAKSAKKAADKAVGTAKGLAGKAAVAAGDATRRASESVRRAGDRVADTDDDAHSDAPGADDAAAGDDKDTETDDE